MRFAVSLALISLLAGCERVAEDPAIGKAAEPDEHVAMPLPAGSTSISCDYDDDGRTGVPVTDTAVGTLLPVIQNCAFRGMIHVYYEGETEAAFTSLMTLLTRFAEAGKVDVRIVEIKSNGGDVAQAMQAGEEIARGEWTVWVKQDAYCMSACVFILAAARYRLALGPVGIHRILPVGSEADSIAELDGETQTIAAEARTYMTRHGVNPSVVDTMMTIPSGSIRILTSGEQENFGLGLVNAAQADLANIRLERRCGRDFMERKAAFMEAVRLQCPRPAQGMEEYLICFEEKRGGFGFPDKICPAESPRSANLAGRVETLTQ